MTIINTFITKWNLHKVQHRYEQINISQQLVTDSRIYDIPAAATNIWCLNNFEQIAAKSWWGLIRRGASKHSWQLIVIYKYPGGTGHIITLLYTQCMRHWTLWIIMNNCSNKILTILGINKGLFLSKNKLF